MLTLGCQYPQLLLYVVVNFKCLLHGLKATVSFRSIRARIRLPSDTVTDLFLMQEFCHPR